MTSFRVFVILGALAALVQGEPTRLFQDQAGRFTFSYPTTFGTTARGTNDGFGDRLAAVAFSAFPARFKGEAVLTRGFPLVDLEAAGGLYDGIALEIFPAPLRAVVIAQLPRLAHANMCRTLELATHLDPTIAAFASWTPSQRGAIGQVDGMRNANPHVVTCRATDDVVVFDKTRSFQPGDPTQHVFGAIRFVPEPYSTFQIIAGGDAPDASTLTAMENLVRSFVAK
jgi:hypothetical protein